MWRRLSVVCLLSLLWACSQSPDEADWGRIKPLVNAYGPLEAGYVLEHLKAFPNCRHREIAEGFLVERCARQFEGCREYFDNFPEAGRAAEMEPSIWRYCTTQGNISTPAYQRQACDLYLKRYPDGIHIAEVKSHREHSRARGRQIRPSLTRRRG